MSTLLDQYLDRLERGPGLTRHECIRLVQLAQHAAAFTSANDRGDDAAEAFENAKSEAAADAAAEAGDAADDAYNRSKDALFAAVRDLMGWPARPAQYPPKQITL